MPAYAILDIDPRKERAFVCKVLSPNHPSSIHFEGTSGSMKFEGATDEELEIIAAMINAIGERTKSEGKHHVEYHGA